MWEGPCECGCEVVCPGRMLGHCGRFPRALLLGPHPGISFSSNYLLATRAAQGPLSNYPQVWASENWAGTIWPWSEGYVGHRTGPLGPHRWSLRSGPPLHPKTAGACFSGGHTPAPGSDQVRAPPLALSLENDKWNPTFLTCIFSPETNGDSKHFVMSKVSSRYKQHAQSQIE